MSVIYATLERLETDNPPLAGNENSAGSLQLTGDAKSGSVKMLAAAILVAMLGAGLMFWYRLDGAGMSRNPVALTASSERLSSAKPEPQPLRAPIAEQATAHLAPAVSISESSTEPKAVSGVPTPAELAAVTGGQGVVGKYESPGPDAKEVPAVVVEAGNQEVGAPVAESAVVPAEAGEERQITPGDTSSLPGVEEGLEQARLALASGQYPQALSALEQLAPVPENRADYWLIKGSTHLGIGQLDLAETAFESAQALAPDNAQIAVQRAILYQERGDHANALQILKGVAIRHPSVPEIYLNQGYSEYALGAVRDAERSFRTFLRMTESRSLYLQQRKVVTEWLAQVSSIQS